MIEANRETLALTESLDMGKPVRDAYNIDIPSSANAIACYAEAIDKLYDQVAPTPDNVLAIITREPIGVVAAVVPWNFPLMTAAWKLGPALAAGNSVILKPAEQYRQGPQGGYQSALGRRARAHRDWRFLRRTDRVR